MSLKKALFIIFLSIAVLILISALVFLQILKNEKVITEGEARRYRSYLLADELRQSSDDLTRMARNYVVTGDPRFRKYFRRILDIRNGKAPRPQDYHEIYWDFVSATGREFKINTEPIALKTLMKGAGFSLKEFHLLEEMEDKSNELVKLENKAMNAMVGLYQDKQGDYTIKGPPNQKLAMELLHSEKYYKAKGKIMRPLMEFFDSIDKRTKDEINLYQARKASLNVVLMVTMIFSFFLIFVSFFLVMNHFKQEGVTANGNTYGFFIKNLWSGWLFIIFSILVIFSIISLSWWSFNETSTIVKRDLKRSISYNMDITYNAVVDWMEHMILKTAFLAKLPELVGGNQNLSFRQKLSRSDYSGGNLYDHFHLKEQRTVKDSRYDGYIVINSNRVVTASCHTELIGKKLEIPDSVLNRIQNSTEPTVYMPYGEPIHPLIDHNILFASSLEERSGFLFLVISLKGKLADILNRNFFGETGEIYMVNSQGQFASEGRWLNQWVNQEGLTSKTDSMIGARVSQNHTDDQTPLVHSVNQVIQGQSATDLAEYKNYLDEDVVGLWRWNNTYRFGLVSEISVKEAYDFLRFYKNHTLFGIFVTILLILILTALFIWNRLKVARINAELKKSFGTIKEQNERLAGDLIAGQKVQMDMLPEKIEGQGFELDAYLNPAQTISGDFYDFSFIGDKRIYFCIGDVSGKGVSAALFMSMTKVFLNKTLSPNSNMQVRDLVSIVNQELFKNNASCMFVTLIVGIMDTETGMVHITNAGHNPPYIKRVDGRLVLLKDINGPLIGTFKDATFNQQSIRLHSGDTLLFYTDGVVEAQNPKEEFYKEARLESILREQHFSSPKDMVRIIAEDVVKFTESANPFDDVTLLSVRYC